MRIHVNIDHDIFAKAMKFSELSTKKAVIETALNFYVQNGGDNDKEITNSRYPLSQ